MIPAAEAMPRMMAGKMNWSTYPAGSFENSTNRASGVQPHQIAGSRITTMAWTKPGIDSPRMAALRAKKSSTLSWRTADRTPTGMPIRTATAIAITRSEEHTSELQSQSNLVCRLLLEKKKKKDKQHVER